MFATGVAIVTAHTAAGQRVGLTISSFNALSLQPPLVLWSLGCASSSLAAFGAVAHYAVNVLTAGQAALAERFATRGIDRWAGVDAADGVGGAPLLAGAAATFECANLRRHDAGDHVLFIGAVERCTHRAGAAPLLYHGGRFYTDSPLGA
ncbi:flavin reductase family protein [Ramlibacter sp. H39-3-26]|uniref:flavin reductase family protein n=1 Tax=Curvibacter soli TaxID=3031331 RepID=UPI0023DCCB87|nr:flavin reductase family protein [Ramlibacter sp. H39-3-26]MDF1483931.1 flavin reductase family protein [Ramlibacter sp. H39-3-26]